MRINGTEPSITVGLIVGPSPISFTLSGEFSSHPSHQLMSGNYTATRHGDSVRIEGPVQFEAHSLRLSPADFALSRFTVHDLTIGVDFHWQRKESQDFQGTLVLRSSGDGIAVVNELPLESYLISVISSEMSASCPPELLRAHAVVSRSWLLAQLGRPTSDSSHTNSAKPDLVTPSSELIRWFDRESHIDFDVCADDHCQRYQGISKAFSNAAFEAVSNTCGLALVWGDQICDARYSKCCGGMTEIYRAAWEDVDVPYLVSIYDGPVKPIGYSFPLSVSENAERWITTSPPAYCNADSSELLQKMLPGFDQETTDFYRWQITYSQQEVRQLLQDRLGGDLGRIVALEPLDRGESGRITRLRIVGERDSMVIGKELEIRRALSRSHLYSSAFVVRSEQDPESMYPSQFQLLGAGWGHGVGFCQIGAAVMAEKGSNYETILQHYFPGTALKHVY